MIRRVLIVDDSAAHRDAVTGLAQSLNYQVVLAENGLEAVGFANTMRFDIIVMDLEMPVLGGREAVKRIRQNEKSSGEVRVPIVANSMRADSKTIEACLNGGFDQFVAKPHYRDKLVQLLTRFVR